ncbi:hypothetical protein [Sphingomonas sp. HMP6]|uniref:hypothetical protein n=1 Tax=Sphingomonas sp. HMP6 TaxID=1517551 RepID=UPI00159686C5|nr:hypothetical protein [Sphingomonas sp. HMP6]BCA58134.1 hypothetical protein HMP06_0903 [Sphingomonas sp. HMP6]
MSHPKRGGTPPFSLSDFKFQLSGGSPNVKPQVARTLSVGFIIEPAFAHGLRISLDYKRLRTSREISDYSVLDPSYIVAHEDQLPGRVVRASPSAADIAKGYTVGRITFIDSTYLSVGRSSLEVVDTAVDYSLASPIGGFRVFAIPYISHHLDPSRRDHKSPEYLALNPRGKGLVIFSACSHAGIVNVLHAARRDMPDVPIHAVIGGYHLSGANEAIIGKTVADFAQFDVDLILPGHCTGWRAVNAFERAYGAKVVPIAVGMKIAI